MEIRIKLNTVKNAMLFATVCDNYEEDIDYICGRYQIDAKSILGIIGIGLERECTVVLHSEDEYVKNKFKEDMKLWALED